jgi:N-acetylmuramoyl-L-alanine amidase
MPKAPAIVEWPLPYVERLDLRDPAEVELLVVHCTELPDLGLAREYGERELHAATRTGNSGHYYIDRDGATYRFVPASRVAHHVRGLNARSLGVELVNRGRFPHWLDSRRQAMEEPYAEAQLAAFVALVAELRRELPNLGAIAGHEDLDTERVPASDDPATTVARKRDPGPLFPWSRIVAETGLRRVP